MSATTPTRTTPATSALRNAATTFPATIYMAGHGESTSSFAVAFSHSLVIESCPNKSPASIAPNTSALTAKLSSQGISSSYRVCSTTSMVPTFRFASI